jgi:hypothetical protein
MKTFWFFVLMMVALTGLSQNVPSYIRFQGNVFSPDSLPVENAYLVSFTTLRAYATDEKGHFDILVSSDDSLKINHLSFKPVVLVVANCTSPLMLYLEFQDMPIKEVSVKNSSRELKALQSNADNWMKQLKNEYHYTCPKGQTNNPYYSTKSQEQEASINLFELIKLIKFKRRHRNK